MIEVTAAIARDSPNLRRQICAARSIGTNGRSRDFGTATPYLQPLLRVISAAGGLTQSSPGEQVRSGYAGYTSPAVDAATGAMTTSVLAAGVGVRRGWRPRRAESAWALRSASFRLDAPVSGA